MPSTLPDLRLALVNMSKGQIVESNDERGPSANAAAIFATGKAPSRAVEAAILVTLNPGNCTAILHGGPTFGTGTGTGTGNGIVEVFAQ